LQDWKCIITLLLDENPSVELSDSDATNLVRLLCASVKKAVGERIVPATDNRKQYYNKAQKVCAILAFKLLKSKYDVFVLLTPTSNDFFIVVFNVSVAHDV